jgi:hypothetical protein
MALRRVAGEVILGEAAFSDMSGSFRNIGETVKRR